MFNVVSLLLAVCLVSHSDPTRVNDVQHEIFSIRFEQNGKSIAADDEITLKREPFDVVFEFTEPMEVLVHASFNADTYQSALDGKPLKKLPGFQAAAAKEEANNPNNEMLLRANAPARWFYKSDDAHSFNDVAAKAGVITCKRHVVQFLEVDSNRVVNVSAVQTPLHLVVLSIASGAKANETLEIHRVPVRINWEDHDE